jgi:hypothetical protein
MSDFPPDVNDLDRPVPIRKKDSPARNIFILTGCFLLYLGLEELAVDELGRAWGEILSISLLLIILVVIGKNTGIKTGPETYGYPAGQTAFGGRVIKNTLISLLGFIVSVLLIISLLRLVDIIFH